MALVSVLRLKELLEASDLGVNGGGDSGSALSEKLVEGESAVSECDLKNTAFSGMVGVAGGEHSSNSNLKVILVLSDITFSCESLVLRLVIKHLAEASNRVNQSSEELCNLLKE